MRDKELRQVHELVKKDTDRKIAALEKTIEELRKEIVETRRKNTNALYSTDAQIRAMEAKASGQYFRLLGHLGLEESYTPHHYEIKKVKK